MHMHIDTQMDKEVPLLLMYIPLAMVKNHVPLALLEKFLEPGKVVA